MSSMITYVYTYCTMYVSMTQVAAKLPVTEKMLQALHYHFLHLSEH